MADSEEWSDPPLWLVDPGGSGQRATPGTSALGFITTEGCSCGQRAMVAKNGKPSDTIAFGETLEFE